MTEYLCYWLQIAAYHHKNKQTNKPLLQIAAQNCRKRKLEQVNILETELLEARRNKERILSERVRLLQRRQELWSKINNLEAGILSKLGSPNAKLRLDENEKIYLGH